MVPRSAKICLLGDCAVGKTSLVRRFVYNVFDSKQLSAAGVRVSRKIVAVPYGDEIIELVLLLWDLTGSDELDSIRGSYLRGVSGAVVVSDITERSTLGAVPEYVAQVRAVNPHAAVILVANKQDLAPQRDLCDEEAGRVAAEQRVGLFLTSARTGVGVEEAFRQLARQVVGARSREAGLCSETRK